MESVHCPVCGRDEPDGFLSLRDRLCGVEGEFRLWHCSQCGTGYLNPRPDRQEIRRFYPSGYEAYDRPVRADVRDLPSLLAQYGLDRRCRAVMRFQSRGHLLDIGCAMGEFAGVMARRQGWAVTGIEMDATAAEQARDRYGLSVINAAVEDAVLPEGTVDVVTMWDVLEHVYDPGAVLDRVSAWLRPGGWILVRTPNADSVQARVFGEYWAGYDSPRHLTVFSQDSLLHLLSDQGFAGARGVAMSGSYGALAYSLRFLAQGRPWASRMHRLVSAPLGQMISMPLVWIADRFGAASITVAAMRPDV